MRRRRTARPWLRVKGLREDERGSFMVLEAILVALLVLTAILFFTSVQRPSTGTDQGGLDLAQVSADTLSILKVRTFNGDTFDTWVTKLALADSTATTTCPTSAPTAALCPTVVEVQDFLEEILPTGSRYSLRIDNGVDSIPLLPIGSTQEPHSGRASHVTFIPAWGTYAAKEVTDGAAPAEVLCPAGASCTASTAAHPILSRFTDPNDALPILCLKAPNGSSTVDSVGSIGPGGATWLSRWQVDAAATTGSRTLLSTVVGSLPTTTGLEVGMHVRGNGIPAGTTIDSIDSATQVTMSDAATSTQPSGTPITFAYNRVPAEALYGTWAGYTNAGCTAGETFVKVWRPQYRTVTGVTAFASTVIPSLTCPSACFSSLDLGLPVIGPNIPDGARITSINTAGTQAALSAAPTAGTGLQVQLPTYSPYTAYGLQLVVWFGA